MSVERSAVTLLSGRAEFIGSNPARSSVGSTEKIIHTAILPYPEKRQRLGGPIGNDRAIFPRAGIGVSGIISLRKGNVLTARSGTGAPVRGVELLT